jgi:acylphosphatase
MKALHLSISGQVQGVGYRAWLTREARRQGLSGWVRNRADGGVEALLAGDIAAVQAVATACRRGPPRARVTAIEETLAEPPAEPGFVQLPTL